MDASIPGRCMIAPRPDPRKEMLAAIAARAAASDRMGGDLSHDVAALHDAGWLASCLPLEHGGQGWGCAPVGWRGHSKPCAWTGQSLGRAVVRRPYERGKAGGALWPGGHATASRAQCSCRRAARRVRTIQPARWDSEPTRRHCAKGRQTLRIGPRPRSPQWWRSMESRASCWHSPRPAILRAAILPAGTSRGCAPRDRGVTILQGRTCRRCRARRAGDYFREPHFEGGIWRYCAAHCGGAEALFAHFREALQERGRIEDPHQLDRIATGAIALETIRLWLWRAAKAVEARDAKPGTATLSLLARQVTEDNCRTVLALVERGLGMAAHEEGTAIERIRRDLGLFLCQAQPDAKRQRAAQALAGCGLRAEDL